MAALEDHPQSPPPLGKYLVFGKHYKCLAVFINSSAALIMIFS
ncbi:hypothetical protein [Candidatus Ishikawella capsulata]|nr:hypothetical protein [Candidatus Ishikawaella capsulata]